MPVALFYQLLTYHTEKVKKEAEAEQTKWILEQLMNARNVTYGLMANQELPPTKAEAERQKKGKPPNWQKINEARERMKAQMEEHFRALAHPYFYAQYMGLNNPFDKPAESLASSSRKSSTEERSEREVRIMQKLERYAEATGDSPIHEAPVA